MKHIARLMLLTLSVGVVAVVLSSLPRHTAAAASDPPSPPSLPVKVTNTPLPVTGSVNAAVTGTVAATQSGTWNVGINGTVPVSGTVAVSSLPAVTVSGLTSVGITNTSATPVFVRDTDNPAKQPFVSSCSINLSTAVTCSFTSVPTSKELVIEMFTAFIGMNSGDRPISAELGGAVNGIPYTFDYPLVFNNTFSAVSADVWVVQQPLTRAYSDPTTTPACGILVNFGEGKSATCQVSGYLVNLP